MSFSKDLTFIEFIKFLLPSVLTMMFIPAYALVDGYFISEFIGSDALASANLVTPLNSIISAVGVMFITGGGAIVSMKLGEKDYTTASKFFSNLLTVAVSFGIIFTILSLVFKENILSFLGVIPELYADANTYATFFILTLPFVIAKVQFAGFSRAIGKAKAGLIMSVIGGLVNIVLDYIFIVEFDMGIYGAGLATLIGMMSAVLYGAKFFFSKDSILQFTFSKIDLAVLKQTLLNGSSEMVTELAVGFTTLVFNTLMISQVGKDGVAAIAVILYINTSISVMMSGFSMGTAPLISYFYGAKDIDSLNKVLSYAKKSLVGLTIFALTFVLLFGESLIAAFFNGSESVYLMAVSGLRIFSIAFIFTGFNMFGSSLYTALGNGKVSAVIAFSKTFVFFIASALILPQLFNLNGIWLIMPITEILTAIIVVILTNKARLQQMIQLNLEQEKEGIIVC